jgi:hypothetical protein
MSNHHNNQEKHMSKTLGTLIETHGIDVEDHLDRELTVPVHTGLQRQGDVIVVPNPAAKAATIPVPATGVPVVRGEAGGNTHAIVADGPVFCDVRQATARNLTLALLTVPEGSIAYLAHPEHAYSGIGAGTYTIRRQREQADELRMVQD